VSLGRKPKDFDKLSADPVFHYQMGRLVGAAEMAGQLLTNQENPDVKQIGNNLNNVVGWFFEAPSSKDAPP
jgi:hypothetical protein